MKLKALYIIVLSLLMGIVFYRPAAAGETNLFGHLSLNPNIEPRIDAFSLSTSFGPLTLNIGRQELTFGPGHIGNMVLGPLTGLDALEFVFTLNWLQYRQFWAMLDSISGRKLFGHRLEIYAGTVTIGLSETALLVGDIPLVFYNPLPIPYLVTQALFLRNSSELSNHQANMVLGIDLKWQPYEGLELYGEFLVDDYPFSVPATAPMRTGGLAGLVYRDLPIGELIIEYARVNRYTYCHFTDGNDYAFLGRPLGHWAGPDTDLLTIKYSWEAAEDLILAPSLTLQRHGEGKLGDRWQKTDGASPIFLSGEIEDSVGLKMDAAYQLSDCAVLSGYLGGTVHCLVGTEEAIWSLSGTFGIELHVQF
ncbi:MAG TPA: hypothetical protein DCY84_07200 [Firmicutes bacterium]|jgi:hypothetical protein|nr:hypothetical protein [Bacillota bacterium]